MYRGGGTLSKGKTHLPLRLECKAREDSATSPRPHPTPLGAVRRILRNARRICDALPVSDSAEPWATLELKVACETSEIGEESLETFSYLLAQEQGVGGVETRDGGPELLNPLSLADPLQSTTEDSSRQDIESWFAQRPGAVVYTTPEHLDALQIQAQRLAQSLGLHFESRVQIRHDDAWRDSWKQFYKAMDIGEGRLRICPSWDHESSTPAEHQLILDPGRAFGTGLHESTRLCLEAIANAQAPKAGGRCLDLGCGSGILGLSAATLWDSRIASFHFSDLDPEAVRTTEENAQLNAPWQSQLSFEAGTAASLSDPTPFDWIFANIRPEVLIPDAAAIRQRLAPAGRLLLSGILNEEAAEVLDGYRAVGLELVERSELRGWTALLLRASS